MHKASSYFLGVLLTLAIGASARLLMPVPVTTFQKFNVPVQVPYQVGEHAGADLTDWAEGFASENFLASKSLVLRAYRDRQGNRVDLLVAPFPIGWKNPAICYRYYGWIVSYSRKTTLNTPQPVEAQEIVAVSPPEQPEETNACLYYWRSGNRGAIESPLVAAFHNKLRVFWGFEEPSLLVKLCTDLPQENQPELAFSRLESFAALIDPIIQNTVNDGFPGMSSHSRHQ